MIYMKIKKSLLQRKKLISFAIVTILSGGVLFSSLQQTTVQAATNSKLSNPNATETTKKVYAYLNDVYGKNILSAQQESTWMGSKDYEIDYIQNVTGKKPAIRGLDYGDNTFKGVNNRAIKYWNEGGLVTICWHCGTDFSGGWAESTSTNIWNWSAVFSEGSASNEKIIAGMDKAAKALLQLQEAGVTVLWKPFHEFDGQWFWWGKGGSANFVKLWKMMYDRYTNYWGLNNLIWVLGYSGYVKGDWYPGDDYVDIVAADTYASQENLYNKVSDRIENQKPIALHECGELPDPDELGTDKGSNWLWFMLWTTSYVTEHNTKEQLNKVYNNDKVITLDKLPNFEEYEIPVEYAKQDVNKDGVIDAQDISSVAESYNCIVEEENKNLDLNEDGAIDIYDIVDIARIVYNE